MPHFECGFLWLELAATREQCRQLGYLWTGDRCLALQRIECNLNDVVAAFDAIGMDVTENLTLPEGVNDLLVEGCSEQKTLLNGVTTLTPIAVLYYQNTEGTLVYRTLSVTQ